MSTRTIDPRYLKSIALYVLSHAGIAAGVWYGGFGGVEWAGNLARFAAWVIVLLAVVTVAVSAVVVAIAKSDRASELDAKHLAVLASTSSVPGWAELSVDAALVVGMAAAGWTITAFAWLVQMLLAAVLRALRADAREHQAQAAGADR
jgi:hypothetical protein